MFGIDSSELLLVAFVALVVIGPKDLPKAMRVVGLWVGRARGIARQFRSGFDNMVREAELEEIEKKWATENERIMREHPQTDNTRTEDPVEMEPIPVVQPTILPEAAAPVSIEKPHVEAGYEAPAADAKASS